MLGTETKVQCFACLGERTSLYKQIPFPDGIGPIYGALTGKSSYPLYRCETCDLIFLHPIPVETDFFKKTYEVTGFIGEPGREQTLVHERDLEILDKHRGSGKILDLGIGNGVFLNVAQKKGWDVYGLEINPNEVEFTKNVLKIPHVYAGTLENHPFSNEFFDCIHMSQVLEHVQDPRRTLQIASKILKPGGVILITTPNIDGFFHRLMEDTWGDKIFFTTFSVYPNLGWVPPFHTFYFNRNNLKILVESCSYQLLEDHSREYTGLWESHEAVVGPKILQGKILEICKQIWADRDSKGEDKIRKYYPELRNTLMQTMSAALIPYLDEVEVALDAVSALSYLVRKS